MAIILCQSKLQSQVMEENLLLNRDLSFFYSPLTQGLLCKVSAAFSSPSLLEPAMLYMVSSQFSLYLRELVCPLTLMGVGSV